MMVLFVSQCEKKAIGRTQKVLDAFAERLGDRTWQALITEEGLKAVKTLLKASASKNTAVACHWLRSRQRRDLLWVVGQQEKFNARGLVPVHYSESVEIKIDEIKIMTHNIFANTKKQPLDQHLFAVAYLAYRLVMRLLDDEKLAKVAFSAGGHHDTGKLDPGFQDWVKGKKLGLEVPEEGQHIDKKSGKFSFEEHPRHNEISLLFYHLLDNEMYKGINREGKERIKHAVYWHHAKPLRKKQKEFESLDAIFRKLKKNIGNNGITELAHAVRQIIANVNSISSAYFSDEPLLIKGVSDRWNEDKVDALESVAMPKYKNYKLYDEIEEYVKRSELNAQNSICRTAVISADRLVSSLDADTLKRHIDEQTLDALLDEALFKSSHLEQEILDCLEGFERDYPNSQRNKEQEEAAKKLSSLSGVTVLRGPAGCGKSKIALEWAFKTRAKKVIWVCPRVQVCQGIFKDLTASEYLPHTKIELCTGEFKLISHNAVETPLSEPQEFSGDIVITTIDQIVNTITTHTKVTGLVQYLNAHVVFDEFHEYISMPAFNLLFAELVKIKQLQEGRGKALLVSATPNPYFVENVLEIDKSHLIGIDSFNQSQYQVTFQTMTDETVNDNNPLAQQQPPNTIVISNTAKMAQLSFIRHQQSENALVFHSKYTKLDKQMLFEKVFDSFKQNGSKAFDILRSGPSVQASLNITCERMVTELTHAENWLQRLGRLDRFGDNPDVNEFIVAVPESFAIGGKNYSKTARFLSQLCILESAKAWLSFLQEHLSDEPVFIHDLYTLYDKFYKQEGVLKFIEEDLLKSLKRSVSVLNQNILEPVTFPRRKKEIKNKIKKHSLRGDNCFVQMAICHIEEQGSYKFMEEYAYDENDLDANLTLPVERIEGYGASEKNLLEHMAKKHHNIKSTSKKAYKDFILLNEARNPETPIYTSYIPADLQKVGGEISRHPHAIYYVRGKQMPIGALNISDLIKTEKN